jgi:hypothetical protein
MASRHGTEIRREIRLKTIGNTLTDLHIAVLYSLVEIAKNIQTLVNDSPSKDMGHWPVRYISSTRYSNLPDPLLQIQQQFLPFHRLNRMCRAA